LIEQDLQRARFSMMSGSDLDQTLFGGAPK